MSQRCLSPPVEQDVDLRAYVGKWYQTYTYGSASRMSNNSCVTANYSVRTEHPLRIDALNCQFDPAADPRPQCAEVNVTRQEKYEYDSQLRVQFFPDVPPSKYNIAALVGDVNYGYQAAAIYSCRKNFESGDTVEGVYIISRTPFAPRYIFRELNRRLRCNGYRLNARKFRPSFHHRDCQYMRSQSSSGFDIYIPNSPYVTDN